MWGTRDTCIRVVSRTAFYSSVRKRGSQSLIANAQMRPVPWSVPVGAKGAGPNSSIVKSAVLKLQFSDQP